MDLGITSEELANSHHQLNKAIKEVVEYYLTEEEKEEINNPKTKSKRRKQLIHISDRRCAQDTNLMEFY